MQDLLNGAHYVPTQLDVLFLFLFFLVNIFLLFLLLLVFFL
uniref:Uncharacterized protein n=1 Tax=viral metagenome TaxID=1070528 RepID=A0A6C0LBM6_9ZZZZ